MVCIDIYGFKYPDFPCPEYLGFAIWMNAQTLAKSDYGCALTCHYFKSHKNNN